MDKTIGYIFNSLQSSEEAVKSIRKTLRNHKAFNKLIYRKLTIFTLIMTTYAIMSEIKVCEQDKKD